jgi:hypothetical protein
LIVPGYAARLEEALSMREDGVFTQARLRYTCKKKFVLGYYPLAKEIDFACPSER